MTEVTNINTVQKLKGKPGHKELKVNDLLHIIFKMVLTG